MFWNLHIHPNSIGTDDCGRAESKNLSECIPKTCALKNICSFYTEQEKSSRDESFSLFNDWLRN